MSTTELHVMLCCSCVACEICFCEKLGDFGREKERVPGESLESIGKS